MAANASEVIQAINNMADMIVVSGDANDLKGNCSAGFSQGKLQDKTVMPARDNYCHHAYLLDPSNSFTKEFGPAAAKQNETADLLNANCAGLLQYLKDPASNVHTAYHLKRLLSRMLGFYIVTTIYADTVPRDSLFFKRLSLFCPSGHCKHKVF